MYDTLKEYKALLDDGVITEAEFEKKKRALLGMPDKEEEQRMIEMERKAEADRLRKEEDAKKAEAEHQRKLEEDRLAERAHQRKLEEAKLEEQARQRKLEEEKKVALEEKQKIKVEKRVKRNGVIKKIIIAIIAILIVIIAGYLVLHGSRTSSSIDTEKINWESIVMSDLLPAPGTVEGCIYTNDAERLDLDLCDITETQFETYVTDCKNVGFVVDAVSDENSYEAYDESGYKLYLYYYDNELDIDVWDPVSTEEFTWPTTGMGALLPTPKSNTGEIASEYADGLTAYITNTNMKEFNAYVDECLEAGFDVDYYRYENSFSGENEDGVELNVYYEGFDIMKIHSYK